jgi:hypothetical protein
LSGFKCKRVAFKQAVRQVLHAHVNAEHSDCGCCGCYGCWRRHVIHSIA